MADTSSAPPQVKILDVSQLPREGELGTNSYTGPYFVRGTSLGFIHLSQEIEWPLSITYVGEDVWLCRYEGANGEPLIQRDGRPYHALHMDFDSSEDLPTLGKRILARIDFRWAADALRFEGEHQYMPGYSTWTLDALNSHAEILKECGLPMLGEMYKKFVPSNGAIFGNQPINGNPAPLGPRDLFDIYQLLHLETKLKSGGVHFEPWRNYFHEDRQDGKDTNSSTL
ncbi:hypothetical protein AMTR_s00006p00179530 [Amborella trichopoda]|uniref:Uncharacterized protein n=1 Tax=Amborella trichopoda TaxID=13333 RepID=W1PCL1_AMBTC|nr:hypothetical protein AMTR_s00006p00179530 [Amborella trichopoda]